MPVAIRMLNESYCCQPVELFLLWIHLETHLHFVVTIAYSLDVIMSCTMHILFKDNKVKLID